MLVKKMSIGIAILMFLISCGGGEVIEGDAAGKDSGADVNIEISEDTAQKDVVTDSTTNNDVSNKEDVAFDENSVDAVEEAEVFKEVEGDWVWLDVKEVSEVSDAEEEVVEYEPKQFRITNLEIVSPELCFPAGENLCMPVNSTMNEYLQAYLDDKVEPLDITGLFHEFQNSSNQDILTIANADCVRNNSGEVESCAQLNNTDGMYQDINVSYKYEDCNGSDSCFYSEPQDMYLVIAPFGVDLGFKKGTIEGSFVEDNGKLFIKNGIIKGFLPLAYAKTTQVCAPDSLGGDCVTLDAMFKNVELENVDGIDGWWMSFNFEGAEVAIGSAENK